MDVDQDEIITGGPLCTFPVEILGRILSFADCRTFVKCKQASGLDEFDYNKINAIIRCHARCWN